LSPRRCRKIEAVCWAVALSPARIIALALRHCCHWLQNASAVRCHIDPGIWGLCRQAGEMNQEVICFVFRVWSLDLWGFVRGLFRQTRICFLPGAKPSNFRRIRLISMEDILVLPKGATQRLDLIQNQQVLPAWGNRSQKTSGRFGRDHGMTFIL
jgi:hypothetical protein